MPIYREIIEVANRRRDGSEELQEVVLEQEVSERALRRLEALPAALRGWLSFNEMVAWSEGDADLPPVPATIRSGAR